MGIKFNADEAFAMAIRSEENGAKFYRRAAEVCSAKGKDTEVLLVLASMEDGHKKTFEDMRADLADRLKESTARDPFMEANMYLSAMTDQSAIEGAPSAAAELTGDESMEQILQTALGLEKASVLFYIGLKDMVPEKLGRERVEGIIDEEKNHIVQLTSILKEARGE